MDRFYLKLIQFESFEMVMSMHRNRAQLKLPIQQPKQRENLHSSVTYKALYNLQSLRRRSQAQLSK